MPGGAAGEWAVFRGTREQRSRGQRSCEAARARSQPMREGGEGRRRVNTVGVHRQKREGYLGSTGRGGLPRTRLGTGRWCGGL